MKITARVYVNRNVFLGCMVLHCTLYRVCTLYTVQGIVTHQVYHLNADLVLLVHCTLYRVCTLYIVQGMYTVHCTEYVHCTLYRVCTLYTVQGMYTVHCTGYGYAPSISLEWRPSIISAYRM